MNDLSAFTYAAVAAIIVLIVAHARHVARSGRWLFIDPLNCFWIGIMITLILPVIWFPDVFLEWHDQSLIEEFFALCFLGFASVIVSYEVGLGKGLVAVAFRPPSRLHPNRLYAVALVWIGIGCAGYGALFASAGGIEEWLAVGRGATNYAALSMYVAELPSLIIVGVLLLLFHIRLHPVSRLRKIFVWVLAVFFLVWLIYLGTRSRTILVTTAILAAFYLPKKRQPPITLLVAGLIGLLGLSNLQAIYRERFVNLSFGLSSLDRREIVEAVAPVWLGGSREVQEKMISRGHELNVGMTVVDLVPERVPYNYGYVLLEFLTRPIPRRFWPAEKPRPLYEAQTPVMREGRLSETYIPGTTLLMGPAFGFVGYWYHLAGLIGLIMGGLLTGTLLRIIRAIYDADPESHGGMVLFSSFALLGFNEAVATPLGWIFSLPFALLPLVITFWLSKAEPSRARGTRARSPNVRYRTPDGPRFPGIHVP